jgi:beta-ureidopropionase / N-carbamoyl-L-amino-acid hydrolase
MDFAQLWAELAPIGRTPSGGYLRHTFTEPELALREWFRRQAASRGMPVTEDGNGNLFAWWGDPAGGGAVLTGSHFDSVPHGGGYDGPLGIVSGFLAIDALRQRGVTPDRPIGVAAFAEEEGGRFGVPCLGSRLLTGAIEPERARALRDARGITLDEAMDTAGADPQWLGADPQRLRQLGVFVELHVEQGRALADIDRPVAVASAIRPHGRWRIDLPGEANHAGTTRLEDRVDAMLSAAGVVISARASAQRHGAVATCGKLRVEPNGVNAIPSHVSVWLDARASDEAAVRAVVAELGTVVANLEGTMTEESWTGPTRFPAPERLAALLGDAPVLDTGAGHDAGILAAAGLPAAMLFVRNPTGVSHSPAEYAERDDCLAGVAALATVLEDLTR